MNCQNCGRKTKKKIGDHHYLESGLSNVVLKQVKIYTCDNCGEVAVKIPRVKALHGYIANRLIEKGSLLTGEEVRFLRKRMGLKAVEFANILGVTKETVSRWENNQTTLSSTADRATRLMYTAIENFGMAEFLNLLARVQRGRELENIDVRPKPSVQETQEWETV